MASQNPEKLSPSTEEAETGFPRADKSARLADQKAPCSVKEPVPNNEGKTIGEDTSGFHMCIHIHIHTHKHVYPCKSAHVCMRTHTLTHTKSVQKCTAPKQQNQRFVSF